MEIRIEASSGVATTEVPDDVAKDLQDTYDALKSLPVSRVAVVDFTADDATDYNGPAKIDGQPVTDDYKAAWAARRFVRQGKAWASRQEVTVDAVTAKDGTVTPAYTSPLAFARKGDVKGNPTRVSFRIYVPRKGEETPAEETPAE